MISLNTLCLRLGILFSILVPAITDAQETQPYAFVFGGYSFNEDFDATKPGGAGMYDFQLEGGWIAGGGFGLRSDSWGGVRFEIEGLINEGKFDRVMVSMPPVPPTMRPGPMIDEEFSSDVKIKAAMVNFLKEIPCGCFTGYVGGGVGIASFGIDSQLGQINFYDSDTVFAWQFIAGVDVPVTQCVSLFTQYRLLSVGEADLNSMGVAFTTDQIYAHSINVGARYCF